MSIDTREAPADDAGVGRVWPSIVVVALACLLAFSPVSTSSARRGAGCTIVGTEGPDSLFGTPGRDVICGRGGNDFIIGLDGSDLIDGGRGNDTISGGEGNDTLKGGAGGDLIEGAGGRDSLFGGPGADRLYVRDGLADRANGGEGRDYARVDPLDRLALVESVA